ncbi:MAG: AMP-binding protein [Bacteroidota bacterium]
MTDPVAERARLTPGSAAVVGQGARTWADWNRQINHAATRLRSIGESRVALRAEDRLDLATLALGAIRAGVTGVLVPVRWPATLASNALATAGVTTAVSDLPIPGVATYDLAHLGTEARQPAERSPGSLAVFTSGSTGAPKAALLSWDALTASAEGVVSHLDLREGDRWLLDLPVAHVGGLGVVLRCARAEATMAVPERGTPVGEAVAALRPTHASFVSTQLRRLLDAGDAADSFRAVLLGGSAIPPALLHRATEAGLPISTSYGLTEMASTVTATLPGQDLGTSGSSLPGREVRIVEGEVQVRGTARFSGYLTPAGLATPFDGHGWFATGDLGRLDAAGRLVIDGRRGLRFVSGGENVQPEAIERELLRLGTVAEAVVVPVPDAEFGQRPVAFVRPTGEEEIDAVALSSALRETVPGFMVPVAFHAWEGARGMKPDRQVLAQRAARSA